MDSKLALGIFNNKRIFITGGTGSFGVAFIKNLLSKCTPKQITIYSRDEMKQFFLMKELNSDLIDYKIGDIRDFDRLDECIKNSDIVIHAAALKHVHLAENNPSECIGINIYGSQNVVRSCIKNNVEKAILISTDKAVAPINLYGSSKLAAEKLFVLANYTSGNNTIFSIVRYGNVVGSRGSIIPEFIKISKNNADSFPVTHAAMTRFWLTIEEGIDFVNKSIFLMRGGETFIPKLKSTKIVDIAKVINPEIPIKIIGLRPGEKLHEVLYAQETGRMTYDFGDYYVTIPDKPLYYNNKIIDYALDINGVSGVAQDDVEVTSFTAEKMTEREIKEKIRFLYECV